MRFPLVFSVQIGRTVHGVDYFVDVYGAGAETVEAAREQAAAFLKAVPAVQRSGYEERVEVRRPCETCQVTGIKPGCKKKLCEVCRGRGSALVGLFPIPS